ncbi:phosphoribosylaminoimidazole carboxylase [Fistulifera solaris]|uniref:phosphoribosylaminoimidazole carboxylase n=1 Tax=Fistulifera solaris TaxID=1519565 RepID=A0A1Z5KAH0_FISSO|nr:phosphoribosylaminoimidazole carboxylase [Fistulifera solaris]|eukprot:GAX23244.1 phosphoribosylaminoimidazole carboxylase [Fistulifera solaris]
MSLIVGDQPLRVACVGGGQLGRMMNLEAPRLNLEMTFLDSLGLNSPAAQTTARVIEGSLQDAAKIHEIAKNADVITVEIEHVNVEALVELEASGCNVQPSARVLGIIRDKFLQKQHFINHDIVVPPFRETPSIAAVQNAAVELGLPLMLKSRRGGYDGKGNAVLKENTLEAIEEALKQLGITKSDASTALDLYAEGWIDFKCEVAVMVVRSSRAGDPQVPFVTTKSYPAVNAIQQDSICRVVLVPARNISAQVRHKAEILAQKAIDSLGAGASGVFGVEMFVTNSDDVLLNEVAPRPHNTGHYTQDACACNQFENHLRAICGLPLGSTDMTVPAAAMVNVLGASSMEETLASSNAAMEMAGAAVHWYGKAACRSGRKMGHINVIGDSQSQIDIALEKLLALERIPTDLLPGPLMTKEPALVGVIMGSHSDLPTMNDAIQILKEFKIPYEVDIVSAHRTPDKLMQYSRSAARRGLQVIIAGAGGAAHLPGMVASMTALPVVGVPVKTSTLSGVDSLYSIVQMPRGIPVATVAIGNAMNAGLLAVRMLAASRPALLQQMEEYQTAMKEKVDEASAKLVEIGSDAFLEQMDNKNQSVNV